MCNPAKCKIEVGSFLHDQIIDFVNESADKLGYNPDSLLISVLMNILNGETIVYNPD